VSTRLKICGITNPQDAAACVDLGVDLLGFNFYSGSPRFISYENSHKIIQALPSTTNKVGLLVRPKRIDVLRAISQSGVDMVQLIEPEDFSDFSKIPVPVIIVKRITESVTQNFELNGAAMILLDTYTPAELGGSGKVFNWSLIPDSIPRNHLILAGGITPENVQMAIDQVNPAVIDVASGAEISPGVKDLVKVKQLIDAVRGH
jgi:phosphoribosylanthranilate isomerase